MRGLAAEQAFLDVLRAHDRPSLIGIHQRDVRHFVAEFVTRDRPQLADRREFFSAGTYWRANWLRELRALWEAMRERHQTNEVARRYIDEAERVFYGVDPVSAPFQRRPTYGIVAEPNNLAPPPSDTLTIDAAEAKGFALLKSWLSPGQLSDYEKDLSFIVIGSDTGKRYHIRAGTQGNIHELGTDGNVSQRWCFAPVGNLAIGDVMLAQKIALETMERKALAQANMFAPSGALLVERTYDVGVWTLNNCF